jgi:uncharacterized protein
MVFGEAPMISISEHPQGYVLTVRAQPGARRTEVRGELDGALKVAVTAPPEDGRANQALVEELRRAFRLKRSQVELMSGHTARNKRVLIRGISKIELERRLKELSHE